MTTAHQPPHLHRLHPGQPRQFLRTRLKSRNSWLRALLPTALAISALAPCYAHNHYPNPQVFDRWTLYQAPGQTGWSAEGYASDNSDATLTLLFTPPHGCTAPEIAITVPASTVPIRYGSGPYPGIIQLGIDGTAPWQIQPAESQATHLPVTDKPHPSGARYQLSFTAHPAMAGQLRQSQHSLRILIPDSGLNVQIDPAGIDSAIATAQQYCQQTP